MEGQCRYSAQGDLTCPMKPAEVQQADKNSEKDHFAQWLPFTGNWRDGSGVTIPVGAPGEVKGYRDERGAWRTVNHRMVFRVGETAAEFEFTNPGGRVVGVLQRNYWGQFSIWFDNQTRWFRL